MDVLIVDYGMGNIASARRGFEEGGAEPLVSCDAMRATEAKAIVVPGVGAFGQAMARLDESGWSEALRAAAGRGTPILGICLGMQLLGDASDEHGRHAGLGLIPGAIRRIVPVAGERVPHVGWNEVDARLGEPLFDGISQATDFYFVHSYRFEAAEPGDVIATVPYAGETVAAVRRGRVMGTQFHPEKSSRAGLRLIRNFLSLAGLS